MSFTPQQKNLILLFLGLPFALLLVMLLINPAYEQRIFDSLGPISGMSLLIVIQVVHGLVLWGGSMVINDWAARTAKPERRRLWRLLIPIAFVLFLLPALWIVVFYPSAILLLDSPGVF